MKKWLLFTILITSIELYACRGVDYRSKELGPPPDQGKSAWCFAYVAADMLTQKLGQKVSATDLAINYYARMNKLQRGIVKQLNKNEFLTKKLSVQDFERGELGTSEGAIARLRNQGYCLESKLPNSALAKHEFYALRGVEFKTNTEFYNIFKSCENKAKCDGNCDTPSLLFPKENFCQLLNQFRSNDFSYDLLKNKTDQACQPRMKPKRPFRVGFITKQKGDVLDQINIQLSRGNIVSYSYHKAPWAKGNHESSIVARRKKGNKCEYLIRNSYGAKCSSSYGTKHSKCDRSDPGNIWVDEHFIKKHFRQARYLH